MIIDVGELQINVEGRTAFLDGRDRHLSSQQFELLMLLAEKPERVVPYHELENELWWNSDSMDIVNTIRAATKRLRVRLGNREFVHVVRNHGVQLVKPNYQEKA